MKETGDTPKVVMQLAVGWSPKGLNRVSLVMDSKNLPSTAREMLESEDSMNLPSTARETLESTTVRCNQQLVTVTGLGDTGGFFGKFWQVITHTVEGQNGRKG